MNTIYYGDGYCSIEGKGITVVNIGYIGALEIEDKTPDGYFIHAGKKTINIVRYRNTGVRLNNLFEYIGEFKIINTKVVQDHITYPDLMMSFMNKTPFVETPVAIKQVMDYSELLGISEDLTVFSENMTTGNRHGAKTVTKTIVKQQILENFHTSSGGKLFDMDGKSYEGFYHIHIQDVKPKIMSGRIHNDNSVVLRAMSDPNISVARNAEMKKRRRSGWDTKTSQSQGSTSTY